MRISAPAEVSQTATPAQPSLDPRLKPAAHEFEACLMKEFLKPLQHDPLFSDAKEGDGDGGDTGDDGEGSGGALMSFGSEALARAISERGGFGIATKILDHFGQGSASSPKPPAKVKTLLEMERGT
jgi:peptidoglycan hydrolase FlgJ